MCVCRWLANGQNPQSVLVTAARSDNDLAQENERLRQQLAGQGQRSVYFGGGGLFMMSEVSEDRSFKVQREAMERIARGAREGTLRNKLKINSLMNDVLKGGFRTTKGFDSSTPWHLTAWSTRRIKFTHRGDEGTTQAQRRERRVSLAIVVGFISLPITHPHSFLALALT